MFFRGMHLIRSSGCYRNLVALGLFLISGTFDAQAQPNIVYIVTDDQPADESWPMIQLQNLVESRGTKFQNGFVTTSLCCPSRVSVLRGQYAHNHGVYSNIGANGGFNKI